MMSVILYLYSKNDCLTLYFVVQNTWSGPDISTKLSSSTPSKLHRLLRVEVVLNWLM